MKRSRRQSGQALIEYLLCLGMIAVLSIATLRFFTEKMNSLTLQVVAELDGGGTSTTTTAGCELGCMPPSGVAKPEGPGGLGAGGPP